MAVMQCISAENPGTKYSVTENVGTVMDNVGRVIDNEKVFKMPESYSNVEQL